LRQAGLCTAILTAVDSDRLTSCGSRKAQSKRHLGKRDGDRCDQVTQMVQDQRFGACAFRERNVQFPRA
jgi:hypothetical protein